MDLSEFKQWDRDDDGFITPEEAMHVYAAMTKTADPLATGSLSMASPGSGNSGFQQQRPFGGPGGPKGMGGPPGGPRMYGPPPGGGDNPYGGKKGKGGPRKGGG
jgi:hypothetical protein